MHELEAKVKPICEMKESLLEWLKPHLEGDCIDIENAGEVIDMIKDLAKAEKSCYEAAYFKEVVKAMKEAEEDEEEELKDIKRMMESGRMGYNSHRSATTGRYTSGRGGGRRGFRPMPAPMGDMIPPYMMGQDMETYGMDEEEYHRMNDLLPHHMRMGYPMTGMPYRMEREGREAMDRDRTHHSEAYDRYRNAKRHYTETRSEKDREEMRAHANDHVAESIATVRDIWNDADPELKKRMKNDFTKLIGEMNI